MSSITFTATRKGVSEHREQTIAGNSTGDLIAALKSIKETSNGLLTTFVQQEAVKPGCRKAPENEEEDEDDSDGAEAKSEDGGKKLKT